MVEGQPTSEPEIAPGIFTFARIQVQIEFEFPQAFPPNTQMLQPDAPAAGNETKVTLTVGTVVS